MPDLRRDVEREVKNIVRNGHGIVTGGALGVDYLATQMLLKVDKTARNLMIVLPTDLITYIRHYRHRASEGVITDKQAGLLAGQLRLCKKVRNNSVIEGPKSLTIDQKAYFDRNRVVVGLCDELIAFQVNDSAGTQNAIEIARAMGKTTKIFKYEVQNNANST